jgi:hypothetical protein
MKYCCFFCMNLYRPYTVKRVDEVVRHPHLVTQDQFTQEMKKVSDIPEKKFYYKYRTFPTFFTSVELVRYDYISHVELLMIAVKLIVYKCRTSSVEMDCLKSNIPGHEPMSSGLHTSTLPLRHTFLLIQEYTEE